MRASPCGHRAPRPCRFQRVWTPSVAAAIRQSVEQARERFLSGIDLAPLAAIAEKGANLHAMVAEQIPGQPDSLYSLSVYPRES